MKRLLAATLFVACLGPGLATAESFKWQYGGTAVTASGQLTASLVSSGAYDTYQVTALTGTRNGNAITFTPCGVGVCTAYDGSTFDDLIYVGGTSQLSGSGISGVSGLLLSTDDGIFLPYYNDNNIPGVSGPLGEYEYTLGSFTTPGADITLFTATATPEPGTFFLLGGAMLAVNALRRRVNR
jgi:hypothetical protein